MNLESLKDKEMKNEKMKKTLGGAPILKGVFGGKLYNTMTWMDIKGNSHTTVTPGSWFHGWPWVG